jgi:hypothetical protein
MNKENVVVVSAGKKNTMKLGSDFASTLNIKSLTEIELIVKAHISLG